uniref:non-specific serine/threonine protein kinase n=1 Tax=Strigamia maritima TaxID=126957 RepID=T1IKT2_STRMM
MTTKNNFDADMKQEDPNMYRKDGYHPVTIGELYYNRYTVVRKLGWGAYSTVWLIWDLQDLRFKALKIVKSASNATKAAMNEIQLLERARTRKGKIVQLLDSFKISGVNGTHVCMVLEVLGDNLLKLIIRYDYKGIPLVHVRSIIRQVLEGLDYLHTKCNIIHTDIKPENVCLDENEICKFASVHWQKLGLKSPKNESKRGSMSITIADLGNGCWVDRQFSDVIQTRPYRSPEVILGVGYGPSADIWSTACMAFELATGHYLFPPFFHNYKSQDEDHLARIIRLLGCIPKRIAFSNSYSRTFFTADGKLRNFRRLKRRNIFELLTREFKWDVNEACRFADFLQPMLVIDPNNRYSAKDSLKHSWLNL